MDILSVFGVEFLLSILPGVVLFIYGIDQFSKEILKAGSESFRSQLQKLAKTPITGVISGAIATAIVQSSTATTIIIVGLVDAGAISFAQSLGLTAGANIGTTITTQLIAFKFTQFAPIFIILGFLIDLFGGRYKFFGKPIFYFGLVFFSLTLIASAVDSYKTDPHVLSLFSHFSNPIVGLLVGFILTNILFSSAITIGLVIIFANAGLIGLYDGILIMLGSNIGTTTTALLASIKMENAAKRAAVAHFLFNLFGVLILLPFLGYFVAFVQSIGGDIGHEVANAHLFFNIFATILFLLLVKQFEAVVKKVVPTDEKEIVFHTKYLNEKLPSSTKEAIALVEKEIEYSLEVSKDLFEEVISQIRTRADKRNRIQKLEAYTDFLDQKITVALLELSKRQLTRDELDEIVALTRISNQVEHFADLAKLISITYCNLYDRGIEMSDDSLAELLKNYSIMRDNLDLLRENFTKLDKKVSDNMRSKDDELRMSIEETYNSYLKKLLKKTTNYGSVFIEMIIALDEANERIRNIRKLLEMRRDSKKLSSN